MGHYDEQREEYEEEQERLSLKRSRVRDLRYDPYKMEDNYKKYNCSKRHLEGVSYHQKVVDEYEKSTDLKWCEFNP
jgi:hypothetical protein